MTTVLDEHQVDQALAPLMFPVKREPLFRSDGQRVNRDIILRGDDNSEISTVSRKYTLLPHTRTLVPQVRRFLKQGWEMTPERSAFGQRRPSLSVEGNGARIFVNLWRKDKTFNMGTLQRGEPIGAAFRLSTGYDAQHVLAGQAMAIVLICTNGMEGMQDFMPPVRIKHIGDRHLDLEKLYALEQSFLERYDEMCETEWGPLRDTIPGISRSTEAIEAVTIKDAKKVIAEVGTPLSHASGWQVYQSVTNYLTHHLKGGTELNAGKNREALSILLNREDANVGND